MAEIFLKHDFTSVLHDGNISYGGNQLWSKGYAMRKSGCGVIAVTDTLIYLAEYHSELPHGIFSDLPKNSYGAVPLDYYNERSDELNRKYFPVVPGFGINGPTLTFGLNRYFRKYGLRLRASWGLRGDKLWLYISDMLHRDIPVILSVGPNFPRFWGKDKISLYSDSRPEGRSVSCQTKAHFVTATGMDDNWLYISSWGNRYCIRRSEYDAYLNEHSIPFMTNTVFIRAAIR